jgi:hypothetical protein
MRVKRWKRWNKSWTMKIVRQGHPSRVSKRVGPISLAYLRIRGDYFTFSRIKKDENRGEHSVTLEL